MTLVKLSFPTLKFVTNKKADNSLWFMVYGFKLHNMVTDNKNIQPHMGNFFVNKSYHCISTLMGVKMVEDCKVHHIVCLVLFFFDFFVFTNLNLQLIQAMLKIYYLFI